MKGNEINWNQLFYFSEIAREKSLKVASEKLGLTPSTMSEHLSQLEKDLHVTLFHRLHRKLVLTSEGTSLFQNVRPLFEMSQRLMDVVSPLPLGCYPVSIGIVPGATRIVGAELLLKYVKRFGPLNLNFSQTTQEELERGLLHTEIDFGLSHDRSHRKDIADCLISASPIRLYASRKLATQPSRDLFKTLPILSSNKETGTGSSLESYLTEKNLHPVSRVTGEDMITLHQFCEAGLGIGAFSEAFVRRLGNRVIPLKVQKNESIRMEETYLLWFEKGERTAAIQHLKQLLTDEALLPSEKIKRVRISDRKTVNLRMVGGA